MNDNRSLNSDSHKLDNFVKIATFAKVIAEFIYIVCKIVEFWF